MSRLNLFLLGLPRVEHTSAPVKIERRKAVALLAYLAVTGNTHSRDALAALLWPEHEPGRAYAYLRNTLWVLKQTPVAEWMEIERESVGLKEPGLWLDVDLFRGHLAECRTHGHPSAEVCAACIPLLAEAVELYQGDFMAGFTLSDSAAFDEWQFFETETLRRELADALGKLVHFYGYGGRDEFEQAIAYARRWLALDSLDESIHRHLMTLYAQSGQQSAALRQYAECARILRDDANLDPGQETADLHRRIRAGEPGVVRQRQKTSLPAHNLPAQPTPFVGREAELAEIRHLLEDPGCRLLTIAGSGGSGKTRLALESAFRAANEWGGAFRDGVFFVPLAPVSAPEFILPTVADALRAPFFREGNKTLQTQFLDHVRERQMLLVLDNVEHLLSSASESEQAGVDALIVDILHSAPGVKLLATSRERVNLRGEWALEISGLQFPTEAIVADTVETYGAVQLFLQSARRADVAFLPTAADLAAIARICRLVEGVPLGIELAAAWVKVLSCQEIATEIKSNLDFLTTSLRDVPERHRSLRAVFAQSWALLSGDGRACFRKLAVFRGGFTREAAQDVAGASLAALSSLLDKSLLRRTPTGRYEMLEVLRQYAEERLGVVPRERDVVRGRHCKHYFALLRRLEPSLKGAEQTDALDTLSREVENIRVAWRWAIARDKVVEIQTITWSLFLFYDIRNRFQEGAEMFREAVAAFDERDASSNEARHALLGFLLVLHGWFSHFFEPVESQLALQRGIEYLDPLKPCKELAYANVLALYVDAWSVSGLAQRVRDSLDFFETNDDPWGIALASDALGYTLYTENDTEAERYAQQSLALRRQLGDRWGIALTLYTLGWIAEQRRMWQAAKQHYRESIKLRRAMREDMQGVIDCLDGIGRVAYKMGDYERARQLYLETLALAREVGNRWHIARALENLGLLAYELEAYTEAKRYVEQSLALYEDAGARVQTASCIASLGHVALALGDHAEARRCLDQALEIDAHNSWTLMGLGRLSDTLGDNAAALEYFGRALRYAIDWRIYATTLDALIGVARLGFKTGAPEQAVELLGFILNHRAVGHKMQIQAQQLLDKAADALPVETIEAAIARGKSRELGAVAEQILANDKTLNACNFSSRSSRIVKSGGLMPEIHVKVKHPPLQNEN